MKMHKIVTAGEGAMPLRVIAMAGLGSARGEILVLDATDDLSLSHYALIISKYSKTHGVSRKAMECFPLPRIEVRHGDQVTIHTRGGRYELQVLVGQRVHHVYLGHRQPLYRSRRRGLRLLEISREAVWAPLGNDAFPAELVGCP
jgi:hypothetical protein